MDVNFSFFDLERHSRLSLRGFGFLNLRGSLLFLCFWTWDGVFAGDFTLFFFILIFELFCSSFSVLQLCYNQLSGSIPTQLASLKNLTVLALQSNQLNGAIPASLGGLNLLMRLDLSSNHLFGSVPSRLADAPLLEVLDVRNNTLSGNVPTGIDRFCNH